jgi:hypothetical protein
VLINLYSSGGTSSFATAQFITPALVGHGTGIRSFVQIKYLLWAQLDAYAAACAKLFVYRYGFFHLI